MNAPATDEAAVLQVIRALRAAGHEPLRVFCSDGDEWDTTTDDEALAAVQNLDDAWLVVSSTDEEGEGWVRIIHGWPADEIVADWTMDLDDVMTPLLDEWYGR